MIRLLTTTIVLFGLGGAGAALADDDCRTPMSQWQPREAVIAHAAQLGIEASRLKIDDGCYEIKGRDADGNRVEVKLDPATMAVRKLEVEFRAGADPSRYLEGARAPMQRSAPKDNPLSEPGSTPGVNQD
jgi:hypothetical protein